MGDVVVSEFMTLDGVIEDPGGAEGELGGWAFQFDRGDGEAWKGEELKAADCLLLGRVTYEAFAQAWPTMEGTGWFGEKMNSMPKYVVSSTLQDPEWTGATVIDGNLTDRVAELKDRHQGDMLLNGSGQLARGLFDAGLVDECRLMLFPVALGRGKRLFEGVASPVNLKLVESRPAGECLIQVYRPKA